MLADITSKKWSLGGSYWVAILAVIFYVIANTFWLFALKNGSGLGRGAVLFSIVSAILAIAIGVGIYREQVNHVQVVGMVVGLVAVVLLVWE